MNDDVVTRATGTAEPLRGRDVRAARVTPEKSSSTNVEQVGQSAEFERALLAALLYESPDGVLVVDPEGGIVAVNPAFYSIWRIDIDALIAQHGMVTDDMLLGVALERLVDPQGFIAKVQELYADPQRRDTTELEMRDGRVVERNNATLFAPDGVYMGYVWFFRDITGRKRRESTLQELANTDELTGVGNRRRFMLAAAEAFVHARRDATPLSVVLLDLDAFKDINDTHGHAIGDRLLREAARMWSPVLRDRDLLARVGGDEFAVLLPGTDADGVVSIASRLHAATGDGVVRSADGASVTMTATIGVATLTAAEACIEDLLGRADASMYDAKDAGRDRVGELA
ncbi:hypothetical protein BH23ACT10_BH23ACT10_34500 [soil metagenome]